MRGQPKISATRVAEIYVEMLWLRRQLYRDGQFFVVPEAWDAICEESDNWKTRTYRSDEMEDFKRKAGIVALGDNVTLTADERLIENARNGHDLSNFILAHEIAHLALDHFARNAKTLNFQLFSGPNGMSNMPPTLEELEANLGAVFFQCGSALENSKLDTLSLAKQAHSDVSTIRKARRFIRMDAVQHEIRRLSKPNERVIL